MEGSRTKRATKASKFNLDGIKEAREGKSRLDQFEVNNALSCF
jgi:hypothetical protein